MNKVKAGVSTKKKSLLQYGAKYLPAALSRATLMNFRLRFPALGSGLNI
jgi:hypothetical protein